jgi:hypothetical protein
MNLLIGILRVLGANIKILFIQRYDRNIEGSFSLYIISAKFPEYINTTILGKQKRHNYLMAYFNLMMFRC